MFFDKIVNFPNFQTLARAPAAGEDPVDISLRVEEKLQELDGQKNTRLSRNVPKDVKSLQIVEHSTTTETKTHNTIKIAICKNRALSVLP